MNLEKIDDSFISLELVLNNAKIISEIEHAQSSDILHKYLAENGGKQFFELPTQTGKY